MAAWFEIPCPAYWASYIINGDVGDFTRDELDEIDSWIGKNNPIDVSETYIGRWKGLICDMVDVRFLNDNTHR